MDRRRLEIVVSDLEPGTVVKITTKNTYYWLIVIKDTKLVDTNLCTEHVMMTSSRAMSQYDPREPFDSPFGFGHFDRPIKVGEPMFYQWHIDGSHISPRGTSRVLDIMLESGK